MDSQSPTNIHQGLGEMLRQQRVKLSLTQADVAKRARISASYYSALENSRRLPPTQSTLLRILDALECSASLANEAQQYSSLERGNTLLDVDLPEDAQALIADIRAYANDFSPRFIRGLRTKIREVVSS